MAGAHPLAFHLTMTKPDDCAFPVIGDFGGREWKAEGVTKREYFAALAMQGLLSTESRLEQFTEVASFSVQAADALIESLNQKQK
jgi:hypothetical protein